MSEFEKIIEWKKNKVPDFKQADFNVKMKNSRKIRRLIRFPKMWLGKKININVNDCGTHGTLYRMKEWDYVKWFPKFGTQIEKDAINGQLAVYETISDTEKSKKLKKLFETIELHCVETIDPNHFIFYKTYHTPKWKVVNTIPSMGCLITCVADIVSYYQLPEVVSSFGKNIITPEDIDRTMDYMEIQAYNDKKAGKTDITWAYLPDSSGMHEENVAFEYGMTFRPVSDSSPDLSIFHRTLTKRVKENKPTLALLKSGDKTHFVVIVGIKYNGNDETGEPTHYIINDPGTNDSKARYISKETMKSDYWDRSIVRLDLFDPIKERTL